MKNLAPVLIALFLAGGFADSVFHLSPNIAFAKKGRDKDGPGRTASDRGGHGSDSEERRRQSDAGGRDDADERGGGGSQNRGRGRGGDIVDVVERALELDRDDHGGDNRGAGSSGSGSSDNQQASAAKQQIVVQPVLPGDSFERF